MLARPGIDPFEGSRYGPGTREAGCRTCLERVERAERMWRRVVLTRWSPCGGDTLPRPEAPACAGRTRRRDVAGGGETC